MADLIQLLENLPLFLNQASLLIIVIFAIAGLALTYAGLKVYWIGVFLAGMPIGMLAGSARFMDALDGGMWSFGDDSVPEAMPTFFAGTFVRHPLALAAADAVLARFEADGGALQRDLNRKTTAFVERLHAIAEDAGVPVRLNHFSSWFMVDLPRNAPLASLFYAYMRHHGVQIWEGRPGFLTLGHTDDDLDRVAEAFARTLAGQAVYRVVNRRDAVPGSPPNVGSVGESRQTD